MNESAFAAGTSLPFLGHPFRILLSRAPGAFPSPSPPPFDHPEVVWIPSALDSDCLRKAAVEHPDLILLETHGPDVTALQLCRSLRSDPSTGAIRLAIWSPRLDQPDRLDYYQAGADDVVTEPVIDRDTVMRLTAEARRAAADQPRIAVADLVLMPDRHMVGRRGKLIPLSRFQLHLLLYLMEHPGIVFSRDQLAKQLWSGAPVSPSSISTAINRLRQLLSLPGVPDLIHTVRGIGYVLDAQ